MSDPLVPESAEFAEQTPDSHATGMTHRQRIRALVGMLLGMFVAFLSSTIVSNALPTIISDLHGTQDQYTWVVVATLLASTATTPIWGKLSDLMSKKVLVQVAIVLFTLGSVIAGFSQSVPQLIAARAVQGLGLGGLTALVVIVIAAMFSPRERGRYQGPMAAVMSVATVAGPLVGGVIVDTSWLGWRWTFFVGAPLAVVSLIVVQRTLNLPVVKRKTKVKVDYLGAVLIAAGVSDLLVWVTLAGKNFAWLSVLSFALIAVGLVLLAIALVVETKVAEPIIPLRLFRNRTVSMATAASIAVGVALFGSAVFLGQYFQTARGCSPTAAGLLTLPMVVGSTLSATVSGLLITKYGSWKRYLVLGATAMTTAFFLLSTIDHSTNMALVGCYLFVLGIGMGMTMQNLVLVVQNAVEPDDLGSASATVSFFRSLGGAAGVSVLGALLSSRVADITKSGLDAIGIDPGAFGPSGISIATLNELPPQLADVVRASYGDGTARIFLVAGILSVVTLVSISLIREVSLRTESGEQQIRSQANALAPGDSVESENAWAGVSVESSSSRSEFTR